MTSDQEPRYRLVDSNGVIRGTLYGKPDGSIAIQETDSGADREVTLAPDGTVSAPSVETESVSTADLTVNNYPSQDHRELTGYISVSGVSSINETINNIPRSKSIIEIRYLDGTSSNNNLSLSLSGASGYDYVLEDEVLTTTPVTGDSKFDLIRPTAGQSADGHAGVWFLDFPPSRGEVSLYGRGAPAARQEGQALAKGSVSGASSDPFDLTLTASAESSDLSLTAAVFQPQPRDSIE